MRATPFKCVLALGLLGAMGIPSGAHKLDQPVAPSDKFDGTWTIDVVTRQGKCQHNLWHMTISHGLVSNFENNLANASGGINAHGEVNISVTSGLYSVTANGKLNGAAGKGAWRLQADVCKGDWTARRDAP